MAALPDYRTKTQIIVEVVRTRIMSGELVPGERLVIRALANDFHCSDIPVREALRTLASEGLVTIVPHGGACVSKLDGNALIELTEARTLLEPEATIAAARVLPADTLDDLRRLLERLRAAADGGLNADYGRLNRAFHGAILAHCPNRTLAQLIEDLWDRAERGRAVHRIFEGHVGASMAHHEEIVRCIAAGDEDALRAVCLTHSAHGLAAVRRFVKADRRAESHLASEAPDVGKATGSAARAGPTNPRPSGRGNSREGR